MSSATGLTPVIDINSRRSSRGGWMATFAAANVQAAGRTLSPVRVFMWTFAVFTAGLCVAPVTPDVPISATAVVYWAAVVVFAMIGAAIGSPSGYATTQGGLFKVRTFQVRTLARRCIWIGALGVMLSAVDRFVIRGAPLGLDFFAAREAVADAGSGPIGVIAAATSSFAAFGVVSTWLARALGQPMSRLEEVAAAAALIVYLLLSVMLGSRSVLLVCASVHLMAGVFLQKLKNGRIEWRTIMIVAGVLLLLTGASAWLILERLDEMGLSPVDSIQLSAYAYTVQPSQSLVAALESSPRLGYFGAALYSLVLYVYHGFYEFCLLFTSYASPHLYGADTLWLPLKLVGMVTGRNLEVDLDDLVGARAGIYTTFVGPLFLDFGWLAPAFGLLLFLGLAYPFRRVACGDWRWFAAAVQVAVIIVIAPVVSLLDSSAGTFPLLAALAMPLLARRS